LKKSPVFQNPARAVSTILWPVSFLWARSAAFRGCVEIALERFVLVLVLVLVLGFSTDFEAEDEDEEEGPFG
jgi:hypothetical protein